MDEKRLAPTAWRGVFSEEAGHPAGSVYHWGPAVHGAAVRQHPVCHLGSSLACGCSMTSMISSHHNSQPGSLARPGRRPGGWAELRCRAAGWARPDRWAVPKFVMDYDVIFTKFEAFTRGSLNLPPPHTSHILGRSKAVKALRCLPFLQFATELPTLMCPSNHCKPTAFPTWLRLLVYISCQCPQSFQAYLHFPPLPGRAELPHPKVVRRRAMVPEITFFSKSTHFCQNMPFFRPLFLWIFQ